jgi:hypothetical protein
MLVCILSSVLISQYDECHLRNHMLIDYCFCCRISPHFINICIVMIVTCKTSIKHYQIERLVKIADMVHVDAPHVHHVLGKLVLVVVYHFGKIGLPIPRGSAIGAISKVTDIGEKDFLRLRLLHRIHLMNDIGPETI